GYQVFTDLEGSAAWLLPNGTVLLAGGAKFGCDSTGEYCQYTPTNTVQIYSPLLKAHCVAVVSVVKFICARPGASRGVTGRSRLVSSPDPWSKAKLRTNADQGHPARDQRPHDRSHHGNACQRADTFNTR